MFEATDQVTEDHLHAYEWFSPANISAGTVFDTVATELALDRHHGSVANYLFLDGHVESIATDQIRDWCDQPFDFAKPQR